MMERSEIMDAMGGLKLFGMRAAYDEIVTPAVKRQHEPQKVVGDLLTAELSEKQARSIKYQIAIAKLPLAKDIEEFVFDGTPINETLVRDLAGGGFLDQQRNLVLVVDAESLVLGELLYGSGAAVKLVLTAHKTATAAVLRALVVA